MRKILLTTALILASTNVFATDWAVNPAASKLEWVATFNNQKVKGQFSSWDGAIQFDPNNLATSSLKITINLASVNSGDDNRDNTLKSNDFFSVATTPQAVYTSSKITKTSMGYVAAGTLSLAGVTKPLAVPFKLDINGPKALATGVFQLSRGAFGVGKGQWKNASEISDMVTINFTVSADAKPANAK